MLRYCGVSKPLLCNLEFSKRPLICAEVKLDFSGLQSEGVEGVSQKGVLMNGGCVRIEAGLFSEVDRAANIGYSI